MVITLPFLTPLGNPWQRMHFRTRRKTMDAIAAVMALTYPQAVHKPLPKAKVRIVRYSYVEPDADGLEFVKPILDAMQPWSKRHPYGVGFIANDTRACLDLSVEWVRVPKGQGKVEITVEPWI